ncbi:MAG TPA: 2OG-Fe(II) oxygenase [Pyrinomonadaceae bacterium]
MSLPSAYDLLIEPNFLSESICQNIIGEANNDASVRATVYGRTDSGSVDERVRKTSRLSVSREMVQLVINRLLEYKPSVEQHFQVPLRDCEEPQFLRYDVGDFFVAHQDGNTGLIRLASDADRRISIVIFLNPQNDEPSAQGYSGGSLKFSDYRKAAVDAFSMPVETGLLVAFRSELTHEVTPVTRGIRYSIASWYR